MNDHWISRTDGSGKVTLEVDVNPVPRPRRSRIVHHVQCLAGAAGAGTLRILDHGAPARARTIEVRCPYVPPAQLDLIETLYNEVAQVKYSPDDGVTVYTCAWEPGPSFDPVEIPGDPALGCSLTLRLRVMSVA